MDSIDKRVADWLRLDRNPSTRREIESLHSAADYKELSARLSSRISFGTSGLRARDQAGTSRMNDLVVIQATQGLIRYAIANQSGAKAKGIVIGHDHRFGSRRFAQLAANVARREGMKVYLFQGLVHTPMVPFATAKLSAAVGLMITASHNPAPDNGYKVYWSNAVQIIPPHDHGIAASIDASLEVEEEAWIVDDAINNWQGTQEMISDYYEMSRSLSLHMQSNSRTPLLFTYTPMHGVGLAFAKTTFEAFGFPSNHFSIVEAQGQPDPNFPTVKFPNPEEKGALDLALSHADTVGSTIVLANDPDADRFCAAEKSNGTWNVFTGDQLGSLFGHWALRNYRLSGKPIDKLAMCASTVSSYMLRAMAKKEGFKFRETLTGFKYLGNEALELEEQGYSPQFAYEEAIGYMNGTNIKDKDGVTALAIFCEMATVLASEGKTVSQHLDFLYQEYGYFTTSNSYFICRDSTKTDQIFSLLRYGTPTHTSSSALSFPKTLATYDVTYIRDLTISYDTSNPPSFLPDLPCDPKSHMISFALTIPSSEDGGDGVEVTGTIRTSGTEPKIKFYLEGSGKGSRSGIREGLARVREAVGVEWLRAEEFGLESA